MYMKAPAKQLAKSSALASITALGTLARCCNVLCTSAPPCCLSCLQYCLSHFCASTYF